MADFLFTRDMAARTVEINTENSNMARSLSASVNRTFSQADGILLFMKTAIEANGAVDPAHLKLLRALRTQGIFNQIAVADAHGDLLFSAAPLARPLNIADREHFQVHTKSDTGQVFVSSPRVTQVTSISAIFLSRRLNDANGNFAGVVTIGLDRKYFTEEFRQMDVGFDNSIVLLRTDGSFLVRVPDVQSEAHMAIFKEHPVVSYIQQGMSSGIYESPGTENRPRIGAYQTLSDYPAFVLVSLPKEIAFRDVVARRNVYRYWAGLFSILLLSAFLAVSVLQRKQYKTDLALSHEHEKAREYLSQMEKQKVEVEMARLDRLGLIGEMAASIGHEVRNPLTTVRGYLQLFQVKKEYSQHLEQINLMIAELDRANSIISEFLSLAKNKRIDFIPVTLNEIIAKLVPLMQAEAIREGKEILLELNDSPPVLVDENEIRQLILNLTRNSLDAMKTGGTITISIAVERDAVLLAVKDTGEGIPPEIMEKLGTPFLTTKENGTGLGLTVCYKIAERHNASMEVETSPNGTTFLIRFKINTP
ncbi:MAG: ATP-binding protein [Negativicutes bacterium]|nr:ATP-binding protein [Negativicutes bacterium]